MQRCRARGASARGAGAGAWALLVAVAGCLGRLPALALPELWRYQPPEQRRLAIRSGPRVDAERTGAELQPGEIFEASAVSVPADAEDAEPLEFLQLADGRGNCRGWVFRALPEVGTLCFRYRYTGPSSWIFQPPAHLPLDLRAEPSMDAERTGERLLPGTVFRCCREQPLDGILYLELEDGRGWAFDKVPSGDILCRRRVQSATWNPNAAADQGHGEGIISTEMLRPPFGSDADALVRIPVRDLCLGSQLKGIVVDFNDAGDLIAIDVGAEVEGFAHISVLDDEFVDDARELLAIGDEVDAIVAGIECSGRVEPPCTVVPLPSASTASRLNLTLARSRTKLRPRSPGNMEADVEVGNSYDGIVSFVRDDGFHVILGDARAGRGYEGFVHYSKIPDYVKSAHEAVKVCDKVRVKVLGIHTKPELGSSWGLEKEGSKPRLELAWDRKKVAHQNLQRGQWLTGTVYNLKAFGLFVEVPTKDGPCQGMVHISQIREGYVEDVRAEADIGHQVQVRVLDVKGDRVKFSMLPERSNARSSGSSLF